MLRIGRKNEGVGVDQKIGKKKGKKDGEADLMTEQTEGEAEADQRKQEARSVISKQR